MIAPIWPFGQRPFRLHFSSQYEEDMYTPNVPSQFGFPYAVASPQFRYPTQYVGVPPTVMQQAPVYMPQGVSDYIHRIVILDIMYALRRC